MAFVVATTTWLFASAKSTSLNKVKIDPFVEPKVLPALRRGAYDRSGPVFDEFDGTLIELEEA